VNAVKDEEAKVGCCHGACRRSKPILIRQGGLSGRWYAVTAYRVLPDGMVEATEKHDITAEMQAVTTAVVGVTEDREG
jgi:hypothetical protein